MRTLDRSGVADVYTIKHVGRTRELTPEGFLLCRDVPIARTGVMYYAEGEVPVEPGPDGIIRVSRSADDLFTPQAIASYVGKSVTLDHPDEDVTPDNWRELAVGIVLNPRRGEGAESEHLIADLLITEARGIKAMSGADPDADPDAEWEVSCGYDADYEQTAPGRGRQFNFIGNHVALVENGRCGPTCSIGDSDMKTRDKKRTWKDRILTAFKARDEEALTEAMEMAQDEMGEGADDPEHRVVIEVRGPAQANTTEDDGEEAETERRDDTQDDGEVPAWFKAHVEQNNARFDRIESALSKLSGATADEDGEGDDDTDRTDDEAELDVGKTEDEDGDVEEKKDEGTRDSATRDSASLQAEFQATIARAEILAPGIKLITFDAKAKRKLTVDRMCAFRRRALERALEDGETAEILAPLVGKKPNVAKMTCDGVATMFTAAAEMVRSANTKVMTTGYVHDEAGAGGPRTIADINAKNREFWAKKGGLAS